MKYLRGGALGALVLFFLCAGARNGCLAEDRPDIIGRSILTGRSDTLFGAFSSALSLHPMNPLIKDGTPVTSPDADAWPDAVALINNDTLCSGILVSPTAVATAAHCLCHGGLDVVMSAAVFGPTIKNPVDSIPVDRQETYNGKCEGFPDVPPLPGNLQDLAYVHLQRPATVKPRGIASTSKIASTRSLTIVGYGADDNPSGTSRQKRSAVGLMVISHNCIENHSLISSDCHANWEMFIERTDAGICSGDSGGPAFTEPSNNGTSPAAIASRFDSGVCANKGAEYVRLDGMAGAWLRRKIIDMPPEAN